MRSGCGEIGIDRVERVEIFTTEYTEAEESYLKGPETGLEGYEGKTGLGGKTGKTGKTSLGGYGVEKCRGNSSTFYKMWRMVGLG